MRRRTNWIDSFAALLVEELTPNPRRLKLTKEVQGCMASARRAGYIEEGDEEILPGFAIEAARVADGRPLAKRRIKVERPFGGRFD
jgi:hypothetical protein